MSNNVIESITIRCECGVAHINPLCEFTITSKPRCGRGCCGYCDAPAITYECPVTNKWYKIQLREFDDEE